MRQHGRDMQSMRYSQNAQSVPYSQNVRRSRSTRNAQSTSPSNPKDTSVPPLFKEDRLSPSPVAVPDGYSRHRMHKRDDVSLYYEQRDKENVLDKDTFILIVLALAIPVVILLVTVLPSGIFRIGASTTVHDFAWWRETLIDNVAAFSNYLTGITDGNGIELVFWRYLSIACVGAALAVSGVVYQGTLKNYLASPTTLGVVSGGTLGAIAYVLVFDVASRAGEVYFSSDLQAYWDSLGTVEYLLQVVGRQLFSLVGCLTVVAVVLGVSYLAGHGRFSKSALIIVGQVFVLVIGSIVSLIRYWITYEGTEAQLEAVTNLTNGVFADMITPGRFCAVAIPATVCIIILVILGRRLNLLSFSDEEARSMGANVTRLRIVVMMICTLMTAFVVAFCGMIGFVGFMVPHFARRVFGADFRHLLPASACLGSLFLVLAYHLMTISDVLNGSLGVFSTALGSIVFIAVLVVQRRRGNANWV